MAIGTITIASTLELPNGARLYHCAFAGDGAYPTNGTLAAAVTAALVLAIKTAELAATDTLVRGVLNPTIIDIIAGDCGQYIPMWTAVGLKMRDGGSGTLAEVGNGTNLAGTTCNVTFVTK
jgi:hypothetical protein